MNTRHSHQGATPRAASALPITTVFALSAVAVFASSAHESGAAAPAGAYSVRVVNMIPASIADEEDDNSEPFLAVNPNNPDEMVASGHQIGRGLTDVSTDGICEPQTSGLLRSTDRGRSWSLSCALPLDPDMAFAGDISIAYGASDGELFGGFQAEGFPSVRLFKTVPSDAPPWTLSDLTSTGATYLKDVHQPWVAAGRKTEAPIVAIGADSRMTNLPNCSGGVVYWSLSSTPFAPVCVSPRSSIDEDESTWTPAVRTFVHDDGTIYAATYRINNAKPYWDPKKEFLDVILFRHDPGTPATSPFSSLKDEPVAAPAKRCSGRDGKPGFRVARCVPVPFEDLYDPATFVGLGQERRIWSSLAVAADPRDSRHVFVAWGDTTGSWPGMVLHVRESRDGGASWGPSDLSTVRPALNPALSVTNDGRLGFAYQRLSGKLTDRWTTELQIFSGDEPTTLLYTYVLATAPANLPARCIVPYLGEYMNLVAVGSDFFGVFSSSSKLDPAAFPVGVTSSRTPTVTNTIDPCNGLGTAPETSIDPYFFAVERRVALKKGVPLPQKHPAP